MRSYFKGITPRSSDTVINCSCIKLKSEYQILREVLHMTVMAVEDKAATAAVNETIAAKHNGS